MTSLRLLFAAATLLILLWFLTRPKDAEPLPPRFDDVVLEWWDDPAMDVYDDPYLISLWQRSAA